MLISIESYNISQIQKTARFVNMPLPTIWSVLKFCLEIVCFAKNQLGSPLFPQGFEIKLIVAWPSQEQRASVLSVVLWTKAGRE